MANGIIIIDKPAGWTSMDVCAKVRGILREAAGGQRGNAGPHGHRGPPVFVGRATRAVEFAEKGPEGVCGGLRLGITTNTQDTTGEVLEERPAAVSRELVEAALNRFLGDIQQIPPHVLRHQGERPEAL